MSIDRLTHFLNLEELDQDNVEKTMPEHSESAVIRTGSLRFCLFTLCIPFQGLVFYKGRRGGDGGRQF